MTEPCGLITEIRQRRLEAGNGPLYAFQTVYDERRGLLPGVFGHLAHLHVCVKALYGGFCGL